MTDHTTVPATQCSVRSILDRIDVLTAQVERWHAKADLSDLLSGRTADHTNPWRTLAGDRAWRLERARTELADRLGP